MFDLNKLPVAPEFVEALQENALEVAKEQLQKLNVPDDLISLVGSIYDLGYYISESYRRPESLIGDRNHRFDIENEIVVAINVVAKYGGTFHGPVTHTLPRASVSVETEE